MEGTTVSGSVGIAPDGSYRNTLVKLVPTKAGDGVPIVKGGSSGLERACETVCEDQGKFRLTCVMPGSYWLFAESAGGGSSTKKHIQVTSGVPVLGVEVLLQSIPVVLGRVLDAAGVGVEGATVLWRADVSSSGGPSDQLAFRGAVKTVRGGEFRADVPSGTKLMAFVAVEPSGRAGQATLSFPADESFAVEILLLEPRSIQVIVEDEDGRRVEGAVLSLEWCGWGVPTDFGFSARPVTNREGVTNLQAPGAGELDLLAECPGFPMVRALQSFFASEVASPLVIRLVGTRPTGTVRARVIGPDGAALAGEEMRATLVRDGAVGADLTKTVVTSKEGTIELEVPGGCRWRLRTRPALRAGDPVLLSIAPLSSGDDCDRRLVRSGGVSLVPRRRAADGKESAWGSGSLLIERVFGGSFQPPDQSYCGLLTGARSEGGGEPRIDLFLPPGEYGCRLLGADAVAVDLGTLRVEEGKTTDLGVVVAEEGGRISGSVQRAGSAGSGVRVAYVPIARAMPGQAWPTKWGTGPGGKMDSGSRVPSGSGLLIVWAEGWAPVFLDCPVLSAPHVTDVGALVLVRGGTLLVEGLGPKEPPVFLRPAGGSPALEEALRYLADVPSLTGRFLKEGTGGGATFENVAPGEWEVRVGAGGRSRTAKVIEGETSVVSFR